MIVVYPRSHYPQEEFNEGWLIGVCLHCLLICSAVAKNCPSLMLAKKQLARRALVASDTPPSNPLENLIALIARVS